MRLRVAPSDREVGRGSRFPNRGFQTENFQYRALELGERRAATVARSAFPHVKNLTHAPGKSRHHNDSIREKQGFFDIMGDEDHRLSGIEPEPQQLILKDQPRHSIQSPEWLIEKENIRING